jgi:hypothetical protein
VLLSLALALSASASFAADVPLVGSTFEGAKKSGFFAAYHLDEVFRQKTDNTGHTWIRFRPTDETLHAHVSVWLQVDSTGGVGRTELDLDRAWVNIAETQPLARDIAQAFLLAATPTTDLDALRSLATTIAEDQESTRFDPAVATANYGSRTAEAYLTFLGRREKFSDLLDQTFLTVQNDLMDELPTLMVVIGWK